MPPRHGLSRDARAILVVQTLRAFAYGLGSVLIGISLAEAGLSELELGAVIAAILAGAALASVAVGRYGDRLGRRRLYRLLLIMMALAGLVFALTTWPYALILAALTGTISTDVVESGPFTSLEQAMLPDAAGEGGAMRLFGVYNTVATLAGSLGALAAAAPQLLGSSSWLGDPQRWLLAYPLAASLALVSSTRLSPRLEPTAQPGPPEQPLRRSRSIVLRLSALFALDSFGGGFVVQTFIAFWLARTFDAPAAVVGGVFFAIGLLQALSFQVAVRLAERIGLLKTMVFTHLPSNLMLVAVAFAPNLESAIVLLLARSALSQMDVPTRQAYVVSLVDAGERTAAAAYTNAARHFPRPFAPLVAGATGGIALGAPFVIGGVVKSIYDLGLYVLFRSVGEPSRRAKKAISPH